MLRLHQKQAGFGYIHCGSATGIVDTFKDARADILHISYYYSSSQLRMEDLISSAPYHLSVKKSQGWFGLNQSQHPFKLSWFWYSPPHTHVLLSPSSSSLLSQRVQLWEIQIAPRRALRDNLKISQEIRAVISVVQTSTNTVRQFNLHKKYFLGIFFFF